MPDMSKLWDLVIASWEDKLKKVRKGGRDLILNSCAFCDEFERNHQGFCKGCPIKLKTGRGLCYDTPYWKVHESWKQGDPNLPEAVAEELKWLKDLRKERRE